MLGLVALVALATTGCGVWAKGQNADGVRMFQQSYYEGAVQRFQQALQNDPQNADAYYNLAATYHRLGRTQQRAGDLEAAENYYRQCLARNASHVEGYRGLAVLLIERGRSAEAVRMLEDWAARAPNDSNPKVELARLYEESGDVTRAKQYLQEALISNAYDSRALAALGRIHERLGNHAQALAVYQRSLERDRLQGTVAERVASLTSALNPYAGTMPASGTRTVTAPAGSLR